jgi:hypothetical protein
MGNAAQAAGDRRPLVSVRRSVALATLLLAIATSAAWAAFADTVGISGSSFSTYTVPPPTNLACTGLSAPLQSKITWTAVSPLPGDTVVYVVTTPTGTSSTTAVTEYALPAVTLQTGQYSVQTRISSGWTSSAATITVGLGFLGLVYTCSTP